MSTTHQQGNYVRVTGTIKDATGALIDPTTIVLKAHKPRTAGNPGGQLFSYTPTRQSLGVFFCDVLATAPGTWRYKFEASGNVIAASWETFDVVPDPANFDDILADPESNSGTEASRLFALAETPAGAQAKADAAVAGLRQQKGALLFSDTFTANRTIPGARFVKVADTASVSSIISGALLLDGNGLSPADPGYLYDDGTLPFDDSAPMVAVYTIVADQSAGYVHLYLSDSATLANRHQCGLSLGGSGFVSVNNDASSGGSTLQLGPARAQTTYRVAISRSKTRGCLFWVIGGAYRQWTFLGVDYGTTHKWAKWYPAIGFEGTSKILITDVTLVRFGSAMPSPDSAAVVNTRAPVNGAVVQSFADGVHILAPWEPSGGIYPQTTGAKYELRYRVQDSANYLFARLRVNAISRLYLEAGRCVAGVETLYGDVSTINMATTGDFAGVQVQATGSSIRISSMNRGAADLLPYGVVTDPAFVSAAGVSAVWTAENVPFFQSFPLVSDKYESALGASLVRQALAIGDSKTAPSNTWQRTLCRDTWKFHGELLTFTTYLNGVGGSTLAEHFASIVSGVSSGPVGANELSNSAEAPSAVLLNLGTNDFASWGGGFPAQWESQLGQVADAIHARWPAASVFIVKPASSTGTTAAVDAMAAAVDRVVAARSFTRPGHDERTWLRSDDNFAAHTLDGVHYSATGQQECASQWRAILFS